MNGNSVREWWTPKQLGDHYSVSRQLIYEEIKDGRLVAHKIRGVWRVDNAARLAWEGSLQHRVEDEEDVRPAATSLRRLNNQLQHLRLRAV